VSDFGILLLALVFLFGSGLGLYIFLINIVSHLKNKEFTWLTWDVISEFIHPGFLTMLGIFIVSLLVFLAMSLELARNLFG
jgi:hypothetical protein